MSTNASFNIYFPSLLTDSTYMALYSLKNETIKDIPRVVTFIFNSYLMFIISDYVNVT